MVSIKVEKLADTESRIEESSIQSLLLKFQSDFLITECLIFFNV